MSPKSNPNQPPPQQGCQKDYPFKSFIYYSKLSYSSKLQVPHKISTGKNRHDMLGLGLRSVVKCLTPMHESPGSVFNNDCGCVCGGVLGRKRWRERGEKKENQLVQAECHSLRTLTDPDMRLFGESHDI